MMALGDTAELKKSEQPGNLLRRGLEKESRRMRLSGSKKQEVLRQVLDAARAQKPPPKDG